MEKAGDGLAVKMLAGQANGTDCQFFVGPRAQRFGCRSRRTRPNVHLALSRLEEGFAFVGLTEEYALSVCLFHAKFGGDCLDVELANVNPSRKDAFRSRPNTSAGLRAYFGEHVDLYDTALYSAAVRRFQKDVWAHNLTRERCLDMCPFPRARRALY